VEVKVLARVHHYAQGEYGDEVCHSVSNTTNMMQFEGGTRGKKLGIWRVVEGLR
jgi:hypothetical protein